MQLNGDKMIFCLILLIIVICLTWYGWNFLKAIDSTFGVANPLFGEECKGKDMEFFFNDAELI